MLDNLAFAFAISVVVGVAALSIPQLASDQRARSTDQHSATAQIGPKYADARR